MRVGTVAIVGPAMASMSEMSVVSLPVTIVPNTVSGLATECEMVSDQAARTVVAMVTTEPKL